MVWIIMVLIYSIIWGIVCKKVIENKGYSENWFWWGFFFGIFAFFVAISKPQRLVETPREESTYLSRIAEESSRNRILKEGGWECPSCGTVNVRGLITCNCGTRKPNKYEDIENKVRQMNLEATGWKCNGCGNLNGDRVFVCKCGVKKSENDKIEPKVEKKKADTTDNIEVIKKFKELLDIGAITQEEFDLKKKELL